MTAKELLDILRIIPADSIIAIGSSGDDDILYDVNRYRLAIAVEDGESRYRELCELPGRPLRFSEIAENCVQVALVLEE